MSKKAYKDLTPRERLVALREVIKPVNFTYTVKSGLVEVQR